VPYNIPLIWGITRVWCFISRITLVVDSNLLCHTLSFVASLFEFWQLGSALIPWAWLGKWQGERCDRWN